MRERHRKCFRCFRKCSGDVQRVPEVPGRVPKGPVSPWKLSEGPEMFQNLLKYSERPYWASRWGSSHMGHYGPENYSPPLAWGPCQVGCPPTCVARFVLWATLLAAASLSIINKGEGQPAPKDTSLDCALP